MIRIIIIFVVVTFIIWLIVYLNRLTSKEKVEVNAKVKTKKKMNIYTVTEEDMKVKGNSFQCPLYPGEYVFLHLYDAIEKGNKQKEMFIRIYIDFNNLKVDYVELDRAKLKKK